MGLVEGAAVAARVKWPKEVEQLQHLFGRNVDDPGSATTSVIDLDGYDYRWLRVRRKADT